LLQHLQIFYLTNYLDSSMTNPRSPHHSSNTLSIKVWATKEQRRQRVLPYGRAGQAARPIRRTIMAGDLPFQEALVIHDPTAPLAAAAARAAAAAKPPKVLLRFGSRVEIQLDVTQPAAAAAAPIQAIPQALLATLDENERFGVEAMQLRTSQAFADAKARRPRDGEVWDMPGCAGAPVPARSAAAAAEAGAPGTSDFLMGSVALGVVIVNGPTAATSFTAAEQTKIVAEVQAGASWLAGFNPWAGVSFDFDVRPVNITTQPNADASDNESRFRNPAVAALGFQANWNGVFDYINNLRATKHTNWTYCVFFVKGYPVDHFGYASIGGPRIVMEYANDGWGPTTSTACLRTRAAIFSPAPTSIRRAAAIAVDRGGDSASPTPIARTVPARSGSVASCGQTSGRCADRRSATSAGGSRRCAPLSPRCATSLAAAPIIWTYSSATTAAIPSRPLGNRRW
jgi:hypothetical protein